MANLFSNIDFRNNPKRSGFDLSSRNLFTAKVGELLPTWYTFTMPGDKFRINLDSFTRTMPVNSAAFSRIREYYDFFYIPFRLLWKNAPAVLTQIKTNPLTAISPTESATVGDKVPFVTLSQLNVALNQLEGRTNHFKFDRQLLSSKLLTYLNYGLLPTNKTTGEGISFNYDINLSVNLFPILAYNKIYYDFYRYAQWEDNQPYNYNVDYLTGDMNFLFPSGSSDYWEDQTMLDLKYCNHNRDLLTGLLPQPQYGDIAEVPITIPRTEADSLRNDIKIVNQANGQPTNPNQPYTLDVTSSNVRTQTAIANGEIGFYNTTTFVDEIKGSFDILNLRMGQALQKFREISQSGSMDYRSQTEKHFGVKLPSVLSGLCDYLGGITNNIVINEVVNNNLAEANDIAFIHGKGISSRSSGNTIEWEAKEHGIIMCIYHALPLIDYIISGQHKQLQQVNASSFPIPEFDQLGMEKVMINEFFNNSGKAEYGTRALGYAPRYYQYKTDVDRVHGEFTNTLFSWVTPIYESLFDDYLLGDNYAMNVVKVNPHLMDTIFVQQADASTATDTFLCSADFDVKVVRNLDYNGLPY